MASLDKAAKSMYSSFMLLTAKAILHAAVTSCDQKATFRPSVW